MEVKTKNKTTDYILGMITGIAIMIALWSCSSPLNADQSSISSTRGDYEWNPLYVKVVE